MFVYKHNWASPQILLCAMLACSKNMYDRRKYGMTRQERITLRDKKRYEKVRGDTREALKRKIRYKGTFLRLRDNKRYILHHSLCAGCYLVVVGSYYILCWAARLYHNTERNRQKVREWRLKNPDKERSRIYIRRRRLLGWENAQITITPEAKRLTSDEWEEIKQQYDYCCAYCGESQKALTQDHVKPLSKGGLHTVKNVVPACRTCNSKKAAKLV